eukprot:SAG11_NODE_1669_length_4489_cov_4.583371_7_plen_280_part_00
MRRAPARCRCALGGQIVPRCLTLYHALLLSLTRLVFLKPKVGSKHFWSPILESLEQAVRAPTLWLPPSCPRPLPYHHRRLGSGICRCQPPACCRRGRAVTATVAGYLEAGGIGCTIFDKVAANPTMGVVRAGLKILREEMDMGAGVVVVSVGGGSSMDAAKAMAVIAPDGEGEDVAAYCMQPALAEGSEQIDMRSMMPRALPSAKALPIIAVPTTSGTASETNGGSVLTDEATHRKLIFSNDGALAAGPTSRPPPSASPPRSRWGRLAVGRQRRCWTRS